MSLYLAQYNALVSILPENQLLIFDELRCIIKETLPLAQEKMAFGVPHFYKPKRMCFIWPTVVPRSGVYEDGVLLGFWNGHLMVHNSKPFRGISNRLVRFVVYNTPEQIRHDEVVSWVLESDELTK